jgi:hypothetical protein
VNTLHSEITAVTTGLTSELPGRDHAAEDRPWHALRDSGQVWADGNGTAGRGEARRACRAPGRHREAPAGSRLWWSPRSAMLQPVLTVWAVPSADRAAIRAWIGATAMASMRAWLQAAEAAPTAVRHVRDLSPPGSRRRADRLHQRQPVQVHRKRHQGRCRRLRRVRVTTASPVRAAVDSVTAGQGCSLEELTVVAPNDPFRPGTPALYRVGLRAPNRIEELSHLHLTRWRPPLQHAIPRSRSRIPDLRSAVPIGVAYAECRGRKLPSEL